MLTFLEEQDSESEVLFKFFETLKSFRQNLERLEQETKRNYEETKFQEEDLYSLKQLRNFQNQVEYLQKKTETFLESYSLVGELH